MCYHRLVFFFFGLIIIFMNNNVVSLEDEGIIGGDLALSGEFGYQVSIQAGDLHICGGGIINDFFVLSAAHCFIGEQNNFNRKQYSVVFGVINAVVDLDSPFRVLVEKIYVPREYCPTNEDPSINDYRSVGDIAVVKLHKSLELQDNPALIKLALPKVRKRSRTYLTYANEKAHIAGFGCEGIIFENNPESRHPIEIATLKNYRLKFGEVNIYSNENCVNEYLDPIYPSHLCAGMIQHDRNYPEGICLGDSGGPLVYEGKTVIGIVSSGPVGCNEDRAPGVYTRVSSYVSFINTAMKDIDSTSIRFAVFDI